MVASDLRRCTVSPGARAIHINVLPLRLKPCVLVVEDDCLLGEDLKDELSAAGADVLGPVRNLESAWALLTRDPAPTAAILDVNLGGQMVYPLADALREQGIPFVFATGYEAADIPEAYAVVPRCEKPYNAERCLELVFGQVAGPTDDRGVRASCWEAARV